MIETDLRDDLIGIELSANQQIHVLQIVREALANVEHHSQARHAWVRVTRAEDRGGGQLVEVTVEDDGVGIATLESPRQHFGLLIMRDRAQMVGGTLDIARRLQGGTSVRLRFRIDAPFGASAGTASESTAAAPAPRERESLTETLQS
jgi:two-component system nitrate/nitrite sensor histidine kinase NarX